MSSNQFTTSILPISATDLKQKLHQNSLIIDTRFIQSIFNPGSIPNAIFIGIKGNLESWSHVLVDDKTVENEVTDYKEYLNFYTHPTHHLHLENFYF